jgi:hypothetical protein
MEEFSARLERVGGMIKAARISEFGGMINKRLSNGASMLKNKPITNGDPLKVGLQPPAFTHTMLSASPYRAK